MTARSPPQDQALFATSSPSLSWEGLCEHGGRPAPCPACAAPPTNTHLDSQGCKASRRAPVGGHAAVAQARAAPHAAVEGVRRIPAVKGGQRLGGPGARVVVPQNGCAGAAACKGHDPSPALDQGELLECPQVLLGQLGLLHAHNVCMACSREGAHIGRVMGCILAKTRAPASPYNVFSHLPPRRPAPPPAL